MFGMVMVIKFIVWIHIANIIYYFIGTATLKSDREDEMTTASIKEMTAEMVLPTGGISNIS